MLSAANAGWFAEQEHFLLKHFSNVGGFFVLFLYYFPEQQNSVYSLFCIATHMTEDIHIREWDLGPTPANVGGCK